MLTANEAFGQKQNAVLPQHSQARHNAVVCYAFLYFIKYSYKIGKKWILDATW